MARNVVRVKQVVNDFLLGVSEDDYVSNVTDYQLFNLALRGAREMGFDIMKRIKSVKVPVNKDLATAELPDDFVDFLRIGYTGTDGLFYTFKENKNLNMSMTYRTDSMGNPIDSNGDGVYDRVDSKDGVINLGTNPDNFVHRQYLYEVVGGRVYGAGGAKAAAQYRINYDQNRIELSSDYNLEEIVVEYIADIALEQDPCIHVYCEEALRQYMYMKIVERKSNIPTVEKQRARQEYYNEFRRAKARLNSFSKEEALYMLRKNFKQSPKY